MLTQSTMNLLWHAMKMIVERAVLRVLKGPDKGKTMPLTQLETTVGASGSQCPLSDTSLTMNHCVVTVSRGRPMITPVNGAVHLEGHRLVSTRRFMKMIFGAWPPNSII